MRVSDLIANLKTADIERDTYFDKKLGFQAAADRHAAGRICVAHEIDIGSDGKVRGMIRHEIVESDLRAKIDDGTGNVKAKEMIVDVSPHVIKKIT